MTLLDEPALRPPKGQVSKLTNRSDEQSWYYVCVAVCTVVAGVFLLLRLPTIFFVKLAILLQYLRLLAPNISVNRTMFIGARVIIVVTLLFYIISTPITIFACSPREKIWNPLKEGHCLNLNLSLFINRLFNILSDIIILVLPAKTVWSLQIPRRKRIRIVALFATGLLTCITNAIGILYIVRMGEKDADVSYNAAWLGLWAYAEISLGIILISSFSLPKLIEARGKTMRIVLSNLARPLGSFTSLKTLIRSTRIDQSTSHTATFDQATVDRIHSETALTYETGDHAAFTQPSAPRKYQARTEIHQATLPADMEGGVAGSDTRWFH
ncbi:MAG: hypothetical protein L6R42_006511 [Xanthoria sp. 1 TBL-2021]|nr:MAG: hypothetical protein L6R42_006511 [Xanthoria sp. 1 TBL-2021]